ncbi:PH domain-containing protein [Corynebacterium sp. P7202]|uniref:PH domain-containing protein n=1 Tax=Corynebacterium pygosceleis TaxID=2800406 RepID=A0A9Q4C7X4_9CORY|nr:PH domain-containing protein [Corynebacterium pygosceleis]MCK7637868.1 PH domain-containing protein [Corynebacterium pygosceleis]MCX7468584.1 PH domain-containing protein [Corynebacterium pygosceleis]
MSSTSPDADPDSGGATTGGAAGTPPVTTTVFRPDRTHLLGAGLMLLTSLLTVGAAPQWLFWILALPFLYAYWTLRSRTTVNGDGITATYAFSRARSVDWADFSGIRFGTGSSHARSHDGREFALPGISFNSVPDLAAASGGRIPDVIAAGRAAADDKVVVMRRDGHQVVKSREEAAREILAAQEEIEQAKKDRAAAKRRNSMEPGGWYQVDAEGNPVIEEQGKTRPGDDDGNTRPDGS